MPLTMNAMVDPVRPMLKCGDVKKCGDVAGSAQNVGTSKHPLKKWGRRQVVGTSKRPTTSPQPGDVPTFSLASSARDAATQTCLQSPDTGEEKAGWPPATKRQGVKSQTHILDP